MVGAGPVGLTLAWLLVRKGISVQTLEASDQISDQLRASTFHPPSLEMIAGLGHGVIEQMLAIGLKADRYQYRDRRTGEIANFERWAGRSIESPTKDALISFVSVFNEPRRNSR